MTPEEESAFIATLPPGTIYVRSENIHNSEEDNDAFRRQFAETNARYLALAEYPPKGFKYQDKQILFIDALGKDASHERWRAHLYYARGLAKVAFFESELQYECFLVAHRPLCYATYGEVP